MRYTVEQLMRKYRYGYIHAKKLTMEPYVKDLLKEIDALKAEVQEANENTTWWYNRFKALHSQKGESNNE